MDVIKIGRTYFNVKEVLSMGFKEFEKAHKGIVRNPEEVWKQLGGKIESKKAEPKND